MRKLAAILSIAGAFCVLPVPVPAAEADSQTEEAEMRGRRGRRRAQPVQLGPRPFFLIEEMEEGELKDALEQCTEGPFFKTDFSIGHRGAALQFPEHTKESYEAAAKQGAGILECDVTFTQDRELVCRHSQCDLHTTTDILLTPLAEKCSEPFTPADGDQSASAMCCTSDITLAEFKTLCGKMDTANTSATSVEEYVGGTAPWRTELYSTCGTVLTHRESIQLFASLGAKMTPELKVAVPVQMPFQRDYTQEDYAQQMIDEYREAGVPAWNVYAQSFNLGDVEYWLENEWFFGQQAVFLDSVNSAADLGPSMERFDDLAASGVRILGPPMWALISVNEDGERVPSAYALAAKEAGLEIITWTLERSGPLAGGGGWYFQTSTAVTDNDGDYMEVLDVLANDVGILGIFSDWPATVTYYANCMGLD